jgi:hypothetical protein
MSKDRPSTRDERKAKEPVTLPTRFVPRFLDSADQRQACVKAIRQRMKLLKADCGCDSFQKELLVEQAVFISVQLETMKVNALEGQPFEAGSFVQACNALSGLLSKLGLEKRSPAIVGDLQTYISAKKGKKC